MFFLNVVFSEQQHRWIEMPSAIPRERMVRAREVPVRVSSLTPRTYEGMVSSETIDWRALNQSPKTIALKKGRPRKGPREVISRRRQAQCASWRPAACVPCRRDHKRCLHITMPLDVLQSCLAAEAPPRGRGHKDTEVATEIAGILCSLESQSADSVNNSVSG